MMDFEHAAGGGSRQDSMWHRIAKHPAVTYYGRSLVAGLRKHWDTVDWLGVLVGIVAHVAGVPLTTDDKWNIVTLVAAGVFAARFLWAPWVIHREVLAALGHKKGLEYEQLWRDKRQLFSRNTLRPFTRDIEASYVSYRSKVGGGPEDWHDAVDAAAWPRFDPELPLYDWADTEAQSLQGADLYLFGFAQSLFPPRLETHATGHRADRSIWVDAVRPTDARQRYDDFESRWSDVMDFYNRCGMEARDSEAFRSLLDGNLFASDHRPLKLAIYLQLAQSRSMGRAPKGPGWIGAFRLARRWGDARMPSVSDE